MRCRPTTLSISHSGYPPRSLQHLAFGKYTDFRCLVLVSHLQASNHAKFANELMENIAADIDVEMQRPIPETAAADS